VRKTKWWGGKVVSDTHSPRPSVCVLQSEENLLSASRRSTAENHHVKLKKNSKDLSPISLSLSPSPSPSTRNPATTAECTLFVEWTSLHWFDRMSWQRVCLRGTCALTALYCLTGNHRVREPPSPKHFVEQVLALSTSPTAHKHREFHLDESIPSVEWRERAAVRYSPYIRAMSTPHTFLAFASQRVHGAPYMTVEDLCRALLPPALLQLTSSALVSWSASSSSSASSPSSVSSSCGSHSSAPASSSTSLSSVSLSSPSSSPSPFPPPPLPPSPPPRSLPIPEGIRLADLNHDGLISHSEYVFFVTLLSIRPRDLAIAFRMFDLDENGSLDAQELQTVLHVLNTKNPCMLSAMEHGQDRAVDSPSTNMHQHPVSAYRATPSYTDSTHTSARGGGTLSSEALHLLSEAGEVHVDTIMGLFRASEQGLVSYDRFMEVFTAVHRSVHELEFALLDQDAHGYLTPYQFGISIASRAPLLVGGKRSCTATSLSLSL
jgi:EF hand